MTNTILIIAASFVVILEFLLLRVVMDLHNHYQTNEYLKWIERQLKTETDNEKYWNQQEKPKEVYVNGNSSDVPY